MTGITNKRLVIGADHAGFKLKQDLAEHLREKGYEVRDIGTHDENAVDYPDLAAEVARSVGRGEFSRGLLVCGTGLGVAITANKVAGVRAVTANDPESARLSRAHNDANVLAIGARLVAADQARAIVDVWLTTDFEGGRHKGRVDKISRVEAEERRNLGS